MIQADIIEGSGRLPCSEMIHLMQLPNPDTLDMDKRPQHGGRDRHFCIGAHMRPYFAAHSAAK